MDWTPQRLEEANQKGLYFPGNSSTRLLHKSRKGWKIGVARQAVATKVALRFLNEQQAVLASEQVDR